jgi:hypothetical protein
MQEELVYIVAKLNNRDEGGNTVINQVTNDISEVF